MQDQLYKRKDGRKELLFILVFFIFSVINVVFGVLYLSANSKSFIQRNYLLLTVLWGTIMCALFLLADFFVIKGKEALTKVMLSVFVFIAFCVILLYVLQSTGFFEVFQSAEKLQEYLQKSGAWMPALYTLLQYLQVVVLPIPSIVSTVAGVKLFGAFYAMVYSFIGILLGSLTAFYIGRKLGYKAVEWMVGRDSLDKWQKKLKGKDNLVLTIMFLLPLFPDDVLCFFAGLSSMSTGYFIIMITISRILAIASTCYSVNFIPFNTWWGLLIWGVILATVIVGFIIVYRNIDNLQKFIKKMGRKRRKTNRKID